MGMDLTQSLGLGRYISSFAIPIQGDWILFPSVQTHSSNLMNRYADFMLLEKFDILIKFYFPFWKKLVRNDAYSYKL